jgi:hypothetical protein
MPVIKDQPLPDGHPFKAGLIVFGRKRPVSSAKPSAPPPPSVKPQ